MEEEIISKLRNLLGAELRTEAHLVYALVQLRKLYERRKLDGQCAQPLPKYLKLVCNWVVHAKLDRHGRGQQACEMNGERQFLGHKFRAEFEDVLRQECLPVPDWPQVICLLGSVLRDCPLELEDGHSLTVVPSSDGDWEVRCQ